MTCTWLYLVRNLTLFLFLSRPQRTAGENTIVTPAALPSIPTPLTSWCPESSALPFQSSAAYTPCPSQPARAAHPTNYASTDTPNHLTPCTIIRTSIPQVMNTIWEPKPGRPHIPHRALEATVTTPTWTQPQPTCTLQQARRLITTTDPDNDSIGTRLRATWDKTLWGENLAHIPLCPRFTKHVEFWVGHIFAVASNRWKVKLPYLLKGEMSQMSLWSIRMSSTLALDGLRIRTIAVHLETAVFGVMRWTKTSNALSRTGTELLCWMHFLFLLLKSHKLYITLEPSSFYRWNICMLRCFEGAEMPWNDFFFFFLVENELFFWKC